MGETGGGEEEVLPGAHHALRRTCASIMLEAGESVVALARRLGRSPPAITLGYYAHLMPEAGSKGRGTVDGLLGERGGISLPAETPPILPSPVDWRFPPAPKGPSVEYKAKEMGGLGKC